MFIQSMLLSTCIFLSIPQDVENLEGKSLVEINRFFEKQGAGSLKSILLDYPEAFWQAIPEFEFWPCQTCKHKREGLFYIHLRGTLFLLLGQQGADGTLKIVNKSMLENLENLRAVSEPQRHFDPQFQHVTFETSGGGNTKLHHFVFEGNKLVEEWTLPKYLTVADPFLYPVYPDPQPEFYPILSAEFLEVQRDQPMAKGATRSVTYLFHFQLANATTEEVVCESKWKITRPIMEFDGVVYQQTLEAFLERFPESRQAIKRECRQALLKQSPLE
jgi:hypothetical protein